MVVLSFVVVVFFLVVVFFFVVVVFFFVVVWVFVLVDGATYDFVTEWTFVLVSLYDDSSFSPFATFVICSVAFFTVSSSGTITYRF